MKKPVTKIFIDQVFIEKATSGASLEELTMLFSQLGDGQRKNVWNALVSYKKSAQFLEKINYIYKEYTFLKNEPLKIFDNYINLQHKDGANSKHISWFLLNFPANYLLDINHPITRELLQTFLSKSAGENPSFIYKKAARSYFKAIKDLGEKEEKNVIINFYQSLNKEQQYVFTELIFSTGNMNSVKIAEENFYCMLTQAEKTNIGIQILTERKIGYLQEYKHIVLPAIKEVLNNSHSMYQVSRKIPIDNVEFILSNMEQFEEDKGRVFVNQLFIKNHFLEKDLLKKVLDCRKKYIQYVDKLLLLHFVWRISHTAHKTVLHSMLDVIFLHAKETGESEWLKNSLYNSKEHFYIKGYDFPIKTDNEKLRSVIKNYMAHLLNNELSIHNNNDKKHKI